MGGPRTCLLGVDRNSCTFVGGSLYVPVKRPVMRLCIVMVGDITVVTL
jgi:hypothetical protein